MNSSSVAEQIQTQFPFISSVPDSDLTHSRLPSTVGDLPSFDFQVDPHEVTQDVMEELERHPELPGVLIVDNQNCIGAVSRKKYLKAPSRPYGTKVFLTRSIIVLYNHLNIWFVPMDAQISVMSLL